MLLGIDYASVDGNAPPDVDKLTQWGARFAILRGSYTAGGRAFVDTHLARDRARLQAAGITVGAYAILGYDQSGPSPEDQMATFVTAYGSRWEGELPVWLDVEFSRGRGATGLSIEAALAWVERAYQALVNVYGVVGTYTSLGQWSDNLGNMPSILGEGPLWLKVPYPWNAHNAPHLDAPGITGELPRPWRDPASPGLALVQFQGDALRVPGMTSTVDLNRWASTEIRAEPMLARAGADSVAAFQTAQGLEADGVLGPATFARLAR